MESVVEKVPLSDIHANEEFNCRGKIIPIDVTHLAKSFERDGQLQPVIIKEYPKEKQKESGHKYLLVAGYHRHAAAIILKWSDIEAKIIQSELDEKDAVFMNLNENIQRKDLTFMQEARAIKKVMGTTKVTEAEVMERLGQSRGWVQIRMMILKLPQDIQIEVDAGIITQTDIRDLYTVMLKEGITESLKEAKKLKEAKERGNKYARVNKRKTAKAVLLKKHRKRPEIFEMMEHIQESGIGNSIGTRCLAWAAGEINDLDLYYSLEAYAEEQNLTYILPDMEININHP